MTEESVKKLLDELGDENPVVDAIEEELTKRESMNTFEMYSFVVKKMAKDNAFRELFILWAVNLMADAMIKKDLTDKAFDEILHDCLRNGESGKEFAERMMEEMKGENE